MNLYRIIVGHAAPKDLNRATVCMLLAESDDSVYEWLKKDHSMPGKLSSIFNTWADKEAAYADGTDEWDNDDYPDFKTMIIANKGEVEISDYEDAYYGATAYGWELLKEGISDVIPDGFEAVVFKA